MAKGKGTYQPKTSRRRLRVHGFMARMTAQAGRIIKARRLKGRKRLAVS
jgi:large subunit ribosomal protein L34